MRLGGWVLLGSGWGCRDDVGVGGWIGGGDGDAGSDGNAINAGTVCAAGSAGRAGGDGEPGTPGYGRGAVGGVRDGGWRLMEHERKRPVRNRPVRKMGQDRKRRVGVLRAGWLPSTGSGQALRAAEGLRGGSPGTGWGRRLARVWCGLGVVARKMPVTNRPLHPEGMRTARDSGAECRRWLGRWLGAGAAG